MTAPRPGPLVALSAAVVLSLTASTAAAVHRATRSPVPATLAAVASGTTPDALPTTAALADAALSTGPLPGSDAAVGAGAARPAGVAQSGADLRVSLHLRQTTVAVGELVEAELSVDDGDGVPAEYVLDWGDGRARPNQPEARCDGAAAKPSRPRPTHWTNVVEYSYRQPGRYTVIYRMRTHGGCGSTSPAEEQLARAEITVVKGRLPSNGGRRPRAFLNLFSRDGSAGGLVVDVQGQDLDGWVTQMIVDFGDGTPARLVENAGRCSSGRGEWPATPYFSHRYEAPYRVVGKYTMTLTVFTAGCDGRDLQQTTIRQAVAVPQPVA